MTSPTPGKVRFGKASVTTAGDRIVLNAVEGWGKTTAAAYAPKPIILMARGETGYSTLRKYNRVPDVDTVTDDDGNAAAIESWSSTLQAVDALAGSTYQTVALDALGGFERLCHEHVCVRDYKGDWGDKGFGSFQKGYDSSVTDWNILLAKLDALRDAGKTILLLSHSQVKTHKNPMGPDYDRFVADCHAKTWAATCRWADLVLFGTFNSITELNRETGNIAKDKGKGIGGTERVLYTEQRDSFTAKNRAGMPPMIQIPNDPARSWETINAAITGREI